MLPPRPWGPWATIGWTLLCIVIAIVVQLIVLAIFIAVRLANDPRARVAELFTDGNVIAVAALVSTPIVVGLVAILISIRRCRIADYLALTVPRARHLFLSLSGMALLLATSDLTSYLIGRAIVPPVMVDVYRTSWLPLLLLALLIAAPLQEEILVRGYLYTGIAAARAGPALAVLVSSVAWGLMHIQYDWYGIVSIMIMGLYLGVVRYKTASLWLTMLLHAIANAIATIEIVLLAR
jgi:membrane protease YdiL (CAAX protease family)